MTQVLVTTIMSALELLELWTGWADQLITAQWVETLLMILAPILVWAIPAAGLRIDRGPPWRDRGG